MAIPKLALIPSTQGTSLYSVLPANGVGDFSFTRGTVATRINSQGLIETVASGVSRLNYPLIDGVVNGCPSHLLEPERLQLIQYSEDFSQGYWTKSGSSVVSGFVSPKGDLSAFKLVEDTNTGTHKINSTSVTSNIYTFSVFAKYNGKALQLSSTTTAGHYANFDLLNGVIGNFGGTTENVKITELKNGWYKCSMTTVSNMNTAIINTIQSATSVYQESYTGDGTSGVYIWGAQLEQGSYPTSYIPNYGTAAGVTRSAETANGAGDASTFNNSEGVLMAEISAFDESLLAISLSNGTTSNGVVIFYYLNRIYLEINNSLTNVSIFKGGIGSSNSNKIALKYKSGNISMFFNGYEILTSTNAISLSGLDRINFDYGNGNYDFNGSTKQLQYFDSALNDSDLEKITSWTSFTDLANGQLYSIK